MTSLEGVAKKKAAVELVRPAQEQGLSPNRPDGLLKQLTKTVWAHFAEIYGASVSEETISWITDKVIVVKVPDGQVANRPFSGLKGLPEVASNVWSQDIVQTSSINIGWAGMVSAFTCTTTGKTCGRTP